MKRLHAEFQATRASQQNEFSMWLVAARDHIVLAADVATIQRRFGKLDPREVETRLLARQGKLRREAADAR